jgi:hypothetical protein
MLTESCSKVAPRFFCKSCDYITDKKSSFNKHLATAKHLQLTNVNKNSSECFQKVAQNNKPFSCKNCYKEFKSRVGLWKHQKKCCFQEVNNEPNTTNTNTNTNTTDKDIIMALINGQSELKNLIIKVIEKDTISNSHNTTNNSHNKTFNLSFYLNETCKDAINIDDFVKSIKVQLEDLEYTGRSGYVEGVSNIIINKLNSINKNKIPIHCSDEKREVLYIKNDGEWIKETDNKPILTKAIKTIANENIKTISEWKNTYPDCVEANSKKNDLYLKIVSNSMSGVTKEECDKNYNKIIKNIVKETVIDKNIIVDKDI